MHNTSSVAEAEARVGCNVDKFSWCEDLAPVNVYLYYVMYILVIGLAFPTMNITTTTLFSKVLGPRRQGTQQGIFQVSGGLARMIGPISISVLYAQYGPRMAWNMEILVISSAFICWCIFYKRMVPLQAITQLEESESSVPRSPMSKIAPSSSFPPIKLVDKSRNGSASSSTELM